MPKNRFCISKSRHFFKFFLSSELPFPGKETVDVPLRFSSFSHICNTRKTKRHIFSYLPKSSFWGWKPPSKIGVLNTYLIVSHIKALSLTIEPTEKISSQWKMKMWFSQICRKFFMGSEKPQNYFSLHKSCQTGVNLVQKIWKRYMLFAIIE